VKIHNIEQGIEGREVGRQERNCPKSTGSVNKQKLV
jgi:hypothetical protein